VATERRPKEIAWSYFERLSEGDVDGALALLNDTGTWWNLRERVVVPIRDMKPKIAAAMEQLPLRFTLRSAVEAGDVVVIEVDSVATMPTGDLYANQYCYIITVWGDGIMHLRAYPDTERAADMHQAMPSMRDLFEEPGR
jgi:ketosteroid isomerase-like protein